MSSPMNEEFDDNNDKEMGLEICDDDNLYTESNAKRLDGQMDTERDRCADSSSERLDKLTEKTTTHTQKAVQNEWTAKRTVKRRNGRTVLAATDAAPNSQKSLLCSRSGTVVRCGAGTASATPVPYVAFR